MIIPIIVLIVVFILIAIRQIGNIKLQIWQIMRLGAIIALITRQISVANALMSINLDVMMVLFSMFVIGVALEES
ncbi:anion transporter, partial [Francisella tularensis subsp. holarctica]|nr:anion transporter [Francisella tularensis subsp. holarctica]